MAELFFHPRLIEQIGEQLTEARAELEIQRSVALDALDMALATPRTQADQRHVETFGQFLQVWVRDYWSAMAAFQEFDLHAPPSLDAADKLIWKLEDLSRAIREAARDLTRPRSNGRNRLIRYPGG
jgi:hypothetical protein